MASKGLFGFHFFGSFMRTILDNVSKFQGKNELLLKSYKQKGGL